MDLPEPEFKALISEYLLILGSKYIDDESLYLKHLQKQAQLQNTHALRQLSVLQQFDAITKDIQSQITDLNTLGYERIAHVCAAIQAQPELPFRTTQQWAICALSGVNSNNSFELTQGNKTIYLDAFYGPFAAMLWLVTHVQEMEHSRIAHFLSSSDANSTLSVIMQDYEKSLTAQQDDLQNLYYNAYRIVWDVLQASREQIQSNVYKTAVK